MAAELLGGDEKTRRAFVASLSLSAFDKANANEILEINARGCGDLSKEALRRRGLALLKPLRARRAALSEVKELALPRRPAGARTFHTWLSCDPGRDRLRAIGRSVRTLKGLVNWPLGWLKREGVVHKTCLRHQ